MNSDIILGAIQDLKKGKMIIVTDDENRENEGDIIVAAEKITEEIMTFIIKQASGLICLSISEEIAEKLDLKLMVENNQEAMKTAFTISIDAKCGISTGISAADRCKTILDAISPEAKPEDIVSPGHMFPLIAKKNGVLARRGHTEASIDLMKVAGLREAAVICEIIGDDGKMLRGDALEKFAAKHQLKMINIDQLCKFLGA